MPGLRDGEPTELYGLNATELTGTQRKRSQAAALSGQKQGDRSYCDGQHRQSNVHEGLTWDDQLRQSDFYGGMTHMDLWCRQINHGAYRHEIDKTSTAFLFELCNWKNSQTTKKGYIG